MAAGVVLEGGRRAKTAFTVGWGGPEFGQRTWRMQFRVLGPLEVVDNAGDPVPLRSGRQRAVLAVLLCHRNRLISQDRLVELVWSGNAPKSAQANLQTYVHRLRTTLGGDRIAHRAGGYLIQTETDEVDADRFLELLAEADAARLRGEWEAASAGLTEALGLWRGAPYDGLEDVEVLQRSAAELEESRLAALEARHEADLARGLHEQLVAPLLTLVEEHPLRERLRAQLMLALHRGGRTADALAAYREGRQMLIDELGIEPGAELRDLHQRILDDDPELPAPPRRSAPALVPAELPADLRSVVGRDDELAGLDRLTEGGEGGPAVVVVSGPPGVGKSTLTIHWAHRNRDRFPDGQVFVHLGRPGATLSTTAALSHLVRSFGHEGDLPEQVDELAALYRSVTAGRDFLLVLDNAADVDQVVQLLPSAAGSAVLVTSRSRLAGLVARAEAGLLDVDTLSGEASLAFLRRLIGRARCDEQLDAAADLVAICGGLPLALGIVGANLASRPAGTLRQYADQMGTDILSSLVIDGDDHVTRAFHDSYAALTPEAQRLFRITGLLPGTTFSLRAAAAALDETSGVTRGLLDHLVMRSLVRPVEDDRYTIHDLLRRYAEQLADERSHERDQAVERYLAWLADAVACASGLLFELPLRLPSMPDDPAAAAWMTDPQIASRWLNTETAVLRDAIELAAGHGAVAHAAVVTAALPSRFWHSRHPSEWAEVLDAASQIEPNCDQRWVVAAIERARATFLRARFDLDAADAAYRVALEVAQDLGWSEAEALVLNGLSLIEVDRGRLKAGYELLRRALLLDPGLRIALANMAAVCVDLGRPREAIAYAERGLAHSQRAGLYRALGEAHRLLGEFRPSRAALETARARSHAEQDRHGEAAALELESRLRLDEGRTEAARRLATNARDLAREHDIADVGMLADITLGRIQIIDQHHDLAHHIFDQVREVSAEADYPLAIIEADLGLAAVALERDDLASASDYADRALERSAATGYGFHVGLTELCLARVALAGSDSGAARRHAAKALDAFGESRHPAVIEAQSVVDGSGLAVHHESGHPMGPRGPIE